MQTGIPPAGSYSEVLVVTDEGAQDPFARQLTPFLARTLDFFVSQDVQFDVRHSRAADVDVVPRVKNIVFCGVANPISDVGRRISSLLGKGGLESVESGGMRVFLKQDLPAPGQVTMIVTAPSAEALYDVIESRGDDIAASLEESCRARIRTYLLRRSEVELTRELERRHGFTLQIPEVYELRSDVAEPPGVELLREGPPRSLGIFWVDWSAAPTLKDRQALFGVRSSYVFQRYDGDVMDSTRVAFTVDRLGDVDAVRMDGYWTNTRSVAGGCYKTYFVYDASDHRLWAVDLLVYAPGLPKHVHFRELLAVAETFRY
jgi:hypothetical protein